MTVVRVRPGADPRDRAPASWTCAFVNNMPDGAFAATERQFLTLLDAASGRQTLEVRCFTMAGVPRSERTVPLIQSGYHPLRALWDEAPDLLVVTGSEPLALDIRSEPYWADLEGLLTRATEQVPSMLLSCLSAHAALALFDGAERTRLTAKCTGVFPQRVIAAHPLSAGLDRTVVLPHSRQNAVPDETVTAAGYQVALTSPATGWSVVSKMVGRCETVLVQGHPEYEPSSLLREYHRDLRRYLLAERDDLPVLPLRCASAEDWVALCGLHQRVVEGERSPELLAAFPFDEAGQRADWPWHEAAISLYGNWLAGIAKRSIRRYA